MRNLLRRRHYWVNVRKGESLPKGKIVWAEPHGGGALEGGLRVCVVRHG